MTAFDIAEAVLFRGSLHSLSGPRAPCNAEIPYFLRAKVKKFSSGKALPGASSCMPVFGDAHRRILLSPAAVFGEPVRLKALCEIYCGFCAYRKRSVSFRVFPVKLTLTNLHFGATLISLRRNNIFTDDQFSMGGIPGLVITKSSDFCLPGAMTTCPIKKAKQGKTARLQ